MEEDRRSQFLGFGPKWIEPVRGQVFAVCARANGDAAQPELRNRFLQLCRREIRMLQCHRGQTDESIRIRCALSRELPILCGDQSASDVAIDSVPEGIDAEHFDVDSLGVHFPQTV
jgi:hypothetical protein